MKIKNLWTIIFPIIFLTVFYYLLISIDKYLNLPKIPFNLNFLSYILISIGSILILWVFYLFDVFGEGTPVPKQLAPKLATKKLVITGPFKYTRNPFGIGMLFILIGLGLYLKSYIILLITIFLFIVGHLFIINIEEKDMEQRFGKEYLEYKKKVPRWFIK